MFVSYSAKQIKGQARQGDFTPPPSFFLFGMQVIPRKKKKLSSHEDHHGKNSNYVYKKRFFFDKLIEDKKKRHKTLLKTLTIVGPQSVVQVVQVQGALSESKKVVNLKRM